MKKIILLILIPLFSQTGFSQNVDELIEKGNNLIQSKNVNEAINVYSKAIDLDPNSSEAYFKRGEAYFLSENDKSAVEDYNKSISIDSLNPKVYFMRGQSNNYLGNKGDALNDYSRAINLDSNYIPPYIKRGYLLLSSGSHEAAFVYFTTAIEKDAKQPADVYFARGYCYQQYKAYDQAISDYRTAIKKLLQSTG